MSNFWADKLGAPATPPQVSPPPPASAPSAAWWAPQPSPAAPALPVPAAPAAAPQVPSRLATHTRHAAGTCPECGGEDYYEVDRRQGPRCYNCGYAGSSRIRNSTQGMTPPSDESAAAPKTARQIPGMGYRPDIIVGHI